MSAIRLLQAERHEDIQHLHRQLMTGGLLQKELLEEAEGYLIQKGIYDVTLIEECDFREYKKLLIDSGRYTRQSAVERSSALRKNQRYWVEQEYGELLAEIKECQVSDAPLKGNIQRFLIRQGIHHIKDIDYTTRSRYEAELQKTGNEQRVMKYLKVFDHIKQYSIQSEISSLPGMARNRMQYKAQIIFLPYLPDPELVKDFEYVQDKQELVWDFAKRAPEKLKKQVFLLLNYILENLYRDDPKERRVRFLLPLHWLYDFCVDEDIEDLERLELSQINQFEKIVEQKVVNVKNSMQIIDNSRKILFLAASEIHWHANVWYMERFHLSEDRLNPSSPVQRLSFIEVTNQKNRELLQEYAKYHVGIGGLTIASLTDVKTLLAGKKVPAVKSKESWNLTLDGLLELAKNRSIPEGKETEEGNSYEQYLQMMLVLKSKEELSMRALDLVEINLRSGMEKTFFRADACVSGADFDMTCYLRRGIRYQYHILYQYQ